MRISIERDPARLEAEWRDLAERSAAPPFLYPGWILRWQEAFGRGELVLVAAWEGRDLVAAIPVDVRRGVAWSPTNGESPIFGALSLNREGGCAVRQRVLDAYSAIRMTFLGIVDLRDFTAIATDINALIASRTFEAAPSVSLAGDWQGFLESRSAKLVHDLARRRRRLSERGDVVFEVAEDFHERRKLDRALAEGLAVEHSGWKAERGTAIVSDVRTRRFYERIAAWAASGGFLRLVFMRVADRPIAFHFALEHNRAYYLVKGGYDPAFRGYAPGKLLTQHTLLRAFEEGLARYEFLGAVEPWKLEWATDIATLGHVHAFRRSPRGVAAAMIAAGARATRRIGARLGMKRA